MVRHLLFCGKRFNSEKLIFKLFILSAFTHFSFAKDRNADPAELFSRIVNSEYSSVYLNEEIFLTQDSYIFADTVQFGDSGTIYTNGHALKIVARRMFFPDREFRFDGKTRPDSTAPAFKGYHFHGEQYGVVPHIAVKKENDIADVNPGNAREISIVAREIIGNPVIYGNPSTEGIEKLSKNLSAPLKLNYGSFRPTLENLHDGKFSGGVKIISRPGLLALGEDYSEIGKNVGEIVFSDSLRKIELASEPFEQLWDYSTKIGSLSRYFELAFQEFLGVGTIISDNTDFDDKPLFTSSEHFGELYEQARTKVNFFRAENVRASMDHSPLGKASGAFAYQAWNNFKEGISYILRSLGELRRTRLDLSAEDEAKFAKLSNEINELREDITANILSLELSHPLSSEQLKKLFEIYHKLEDFSFRYGDIMQSIVNDQVGPAQEKINNAIFELGENINADVLPLYTYNQVNFMRAIKDEKFSLNKLDHLEPFEGAYEIDKLYYTVAPPPAPPAPPPPPPPPPPRERSPRSNEGHRDR
jgi:hypothetical protein